MQEGWLERRVGSGTYVSLRPSHSEAAQERAFVLVTPFAKQPEEDVYLQAPFRAISDYTTQEHASLLVTQSLESHFVQVVDRYPQAAFLFVAPSEQSREPLCQLHQQRVPFVVLGASWPDAPFACVDSDNVGAAYTAVEYLRQLGHERIGFVTGLLDATNCRDRLAGYRQGMATHGLPIHPEWIIEAGSNRELGEASQRQLTELLIRREPLTALVSAGFFLTMSVLEQLRRLQVRVPQEVSLISFDDPPGAGYLFPPLTTLKQPLYTMGQQAVERVQGLLSGSTEEGTGVEYLPVDLIVRGSCERLK